jgi:hypothetical protein
VLFNSASPVFSGPVLFTNTPVAWPGADLFAGDVRSIRLTINPGDLDKLRTQAREFVPATVEENGEVYPDVALHLKGSVGSFRPLDDKPGFTLDFCLFRPGRKFHGLRRIHLNNSVEDPAYCNEQLGSEVFRTAGIPAPRVTHALVMLNERRLGLYVLKEGFTEDFLSCYFGKISGNLFEPGEGHDVNQHLKRTRLDAPAQSRKLLKSLGDAALENDLNRRWTRLHTVMDVDRFTRFMALEVMLAHRDGYCLARNNFKLYQDIDSGRMVFLPQGMDQLFGVEELPWEPHMAGLVARSIFEVPAGRQQYSDQFRGLFATVFRQGYLTNRVAQIIEPLKQALTEPEFQNLQQEAEKLEQRILQRGHFLAEQLRRPEPEPIQFKEGAASLAGWESADPPAQGQMHKGVGPDGRLCLHIVARSETFASWRTKARLLQGRYRFEGKARVSGVKPLSTGAHQGAGLRIGGRPRQSEDLLGTSTWSLLATEFEVGQSGGDVEFICELRASSGEAWYDSASLQVRRVD